MHSRRSALQFPVTNLRRNGAVPAPNFFIKYSGVRKLPPDLKTVSNASENLPRVSTKGGNQSGAEKFLRSNAPLFLLVAFRRFRHSPWSAPRRTLRRQKRCSRTSFQSSRVHKDHKPVPSWYIYIVQNLLSGTHREVYAANQQMTIEWLQC